MFAHTLVNYHEQLSSLILRLVTWTIIFKLQYVWWRHWQRPKSFKLFFL